MQKILVIRFGSLGDLCLLGWTLQRLAADRNLGQREVTLVTKSAFAPLLEHAGGVDRIVTLSDSGMAGLTRTAATLRAEPWDVVIDAHDVLRSRLLLLLLGRRPDARLRKDTWARLALLKLGRDSARLQRTMHDRFGDLLAAVPHLDDSDRARLLSRSDLRPPLSEAVGRPGSAAGTAATTTLGLAPGAQWDSKRWPVEHFAELLRRFRLANAGPIRIFLGPREEAWYPGSALALAAQDSPDVEVVADLSLPRVAELLAHCDLLLTNDSGLLHVAEAVGTPVLALFGPTVRQFGYYPCLPQSRVLERRLDCRPCSRNGKRPCHRGDLACLAEINVDQVLRNVVQMLHDRQPPAVKGRP